MIGSIFGIEALELSSVGMLFIILLVAVGIICILHLLPGTALKNNPLLAIAAYFLFSVASFSGGFAVFQPINLDSLYLSCYFGLILSGGYLHHQVIGYDSDLKSSVKTFAVRWGVAKTEFGSIILFGLAAVIWSILFSTDKIGKEEFVPLTVAFIIQLATFVRYRNRTYEDRIDYRSGYRFLYFAAFVLITILKLSKL